MLSNVSNTNSGNKTKSVVEKKHYEEIENRLDEMQTEIDANSSAIAQNASDIETLDDRIDAVEDNSTFESISTDTIYPATGQTVIVDGDALVTGTLGAHDINTTELTVDGVSFTDVASEAVTALSNSRAANYTANQARSKANEVDEKVDNLISSMATELDTDLLKADEGRFDALTSDVGTIDEITSHEITTDILNADMVKAVGKLVRPTIGQSYYTIDIPENCITTLKGTFTVDGVSKYLFISSTPGSLYYYQESLEIIKTISFNRATGAARIVLKTDNDFDYISISNGDTVTILDGDNAYANYVFIPEKLRGVITRGFWTNETETVVTGILKAYQLQAENEHFESTSVDDLFIEKSLNVPEQWDQSGIACFSSGLPDQYLSIDTMDGVTHPRWKDSANEATGTLNETNRLVTEESVAKWNGTSCDGTNEYYPITNIGDNAEVHGSATVDEDLAVTCDATVGGDLTVTGSAHLNADSADKLHTARCINGTAFDGTDDITTSKWGTARTITVQDNDGSNSTCTENVDGSTDITLSLPATIKADVDGIACNAKCIEIKADSCNAEYNIPFETTSNATYQELGKDSCLKFNPSTNQLSTDRLCGTECVDTPLLKATQADITCNFTVGKNAVIAGDLTVAGTMHVNETENISTGADIITMRTNNNSSLGTGCVSGLFINNYDGVNSMVLGTDKNGTFRVGDSAGTSTSYAEIYTDDENWYNGTYPNGVQFTFSGSLTSYSSLRIETDTSVTPPKTYKIYDDAVITSVDISDMEPLATRAEASDMQDGYVSVWNSTGTDLVTNVNEAKVHGLVSDCKVCGVDFHGTNFCGTDLYGCLHGNVDGNAATASKVATASNTTCATFYPTFVDSNNGTAANESVYTDADLNYNPNTNVLSVPNVNASGKVCATNGFTSASNGLMIRPECSDEINIYSPNNDKTKVCVNHRGGINTVWIGAGDGSSCLGTVCAATFCGALSGLATGTSTYNNYCLYNCFTGNADIPVIMSDTNCALGYSAVCTLTFNPATGVTNMSGHQCAGYKCKYYRYCSGQEHFLLVKVDSDDTKNSNPLKLHVYDSDYVITSTDNNIGCAKVTGTGNYGLLHATVATCSDGNSYYWLHVSGWRTFNFTADSPITVLCDTTTEPSGLTWTTPTRINAQVETTATSCNANYYLTFVDSNNGTAAAENVYTNAGLYYNPNLHRLCNVGSAACSFLDPDNLNLSGSTPMIDLRYGNYEGSYTTRLVHAASTEFDIIVNNGCGSTAPTQESTFRFGSHGTFIAPGNIITSACFSGRGLIADVPSGNTVCDLTFTARCHSGAGLSSYDMCLCGANGVLYLPQGANIPTTRNTNEDSNIPVSGMAICLSAAPQCYKTFIGTDYTADTFRNVISIRHRNGGGGDGDCWGVAIYQPMTSIGHWCYNQQHAGTWCGEQQLIDSTGGQTIAGNLTVHNSSNNAVLAADIIGTTCVGSIPTYASGLQSCAIIGCNCNVCLCTLIQCARTYNPYAYTGGTYHFSHSYAHSVCVTLPSGCTVNTSGGTLRLFPYHASCSIWTQNQAVILTENGWDVFNFHSDSSCSCTFMELPYIGNIKATGNASIQCNLTVGSGLTVASNAACPISLTCGSYKVELDCEDSVSIGYGTQTAGTESVAVGKLASTNTNATASVAIGCDVHTCESYSVAIGSDAYACCTNSIAIGYYAVANGVDSISIGCNAYACCPNSIAIGTDACANGDGIGLWSIAIGCGAHACDSALAIGYCANAFGGIAGVVRDCHVVYGHAASAHFRFSCTQTQADIYTVLACMGKCLSPMWPAGCGCTYCGRHMVPARWIIRSGTCSEAGNWMSWDGDNNIDLTGTALGNDHAINKNCSCCMPGRLEIWADWNTTQYCSCI